MTLKCSSIYLNEYIENYFYPVLTGLILDYISPTINMFELSHIPTKYIRNFIVEIFDHNFHHVKLIHKINT